MDLFKSQLDRIQKQLSALTPSQKMLTASMVAIMVMTLVWWGRTAGEPEMEALLPQGISADELPRVEMELESKGINHVMSGDKILVPHDRKLEAVAALMYSHAMPRNAKDGFDEVLKNINPFMSERQAGDQWNHGKELTLSQLISEFPDVAEAHVIISREREVRIGGGIEPSAMVTISTRPGAKSLQQLVDAAADLVEGAQGSLPRNKIHVVVNGMPRHISQNNSDSGFTDDQQEKIQKAENFAEGKIKGLLSYIPNLMVSVTVKLNTTLEVVNSTAYNPKTSVSKEAEIESKSTDTTGGTSVGGEPGVIPNAGMSVSAGPAPIVSPSNTTTEERTKMENHIGETRTARTTPAGDTTVIGAAVRIPMTYFAAMYTHANPKVTDPTDEQLHPLVDLEIAKIRSDVLKWTALAKDSDVAVATYMDPSPVAVLPQMASSGLSLSMLGAGHVKEAILGAMALLSLFMVSMVVKKGAMSPILATSNSGVTGGAGSGSGMGIFDVMAEQIRDAAAGGGALDGMELDEETVRTQQMLEQVSSLVKEDPDSAATLVKRWMNRS